MAKNRYDMDEEYNQKADLKCLKSLGKYIKPHRKILVRFYVFAQSLQAFQVGFLVIFFVHIVSVFSH